MPRRIEIVVHVIDGRIFITRHAPRRIASAPGCSTSEADPRLTVHLKGAVEADVPATARVITDPAERRSRSPTGSPRTPGAARTSTAMAAYAPMIEVTPATALAA